MAKNVGWIKLFRKLIDNRMYFEEPFDKTHAWIDLILIADHSGEIRTSIPQLANRWKWSQNKVRRYFAKLEADDMIHTVGSHGGSTNGTTISLVKYKDYQLGGRTNESTDERTDGITEWGKGDIYNNNITRRREEKNTPYNLTVIPPEGARKQTEYEAEFNEIWKQYPKKQGKANALKDYIKARKSGVDRETIETGLAAYVDYCNRNHRFFKDGSTWFHQHCWEDDYSEDEPFKRTGETEEPTFSVTEHLRKMQEEGLM